MSLAVSIELGSEGLPAPAFAATSMAWYEHGLVVTDLLWLESRRRWLPEHSKASGFLY